MAIVGPMTAPSDRAAIALETTLRALKSAERDRSALVPGTSAHSAAAARERRLADQVWEIADRESRRDHADT
jgi:hypothetical protein